MALGVPVDDAPTRASRARSSRLTKGVSGLQPIGKMLVIFGLALATIGLVLWLAGGRLGWLGKLPGDLRIGDSIFVPITSCVVVSVVLTVLVNLVARLFGR